MVEGRGGRGERGGKGGTREIETETEIEIVVTAIDPRSITGTDNLERSVQEAIVTLANTIEEKRGNERARLIAVGSFFLLIIVYILECVYNVVTTCTHAYIYYVYV